MVFGARNATGSGRRRGMLTFVNVLVFMLLVCAIMAYALFPAKGGLKRAKASIHISIVQGSDGISFKHQPTIEIMPLGDSITAGEKSTASGGYRVGLWNDLKKQSWHVEFVGSRTNGPVSLADRYHEGHGGWRIDQISAHITNWLESYHPQVILLHIGTNDIIQHYSINVVISRLKTLLYQITTLEPDVTLFVAQIIPLRKPALNVEVKQLNSAIPGLVRALDAQGKYVHYVDMYDAIPASGFADNIHPNDTGYELLANAWFKALQPML